MAGEVSYRKASVEDIDCVVEIVKEVVPLLNAQGNYQWNDTYPLRSDFEKDVQNQELWVAVLNDQIVGFGAITTDQPEEYADCGLDISKEAVVAHRVAVTPRVRNKGIAAGILSLSDHVAKERNMKILRVDTNAINMPMQRVIEKLGYTYFGEVSFKNKPPSMRFKCYEKIFD